MEKLYSLEVLCKCTSAQILALNEALIEAAERAGLHIVTIIQEAPDENQNSEL